MSQANQSMPSREDLLNAMADYWGGIGCPRRLDSVTGLYHFGNVDDYQYVATPPETRTTYFEDNGRPFAGITPAGRWTVRAYRAAPDDFFEVGVDGSYTNWRGVTINIVPDHDEETN